MLSNALPNPFRSRTAGGLVVIIVAANAYAGVSGTSQEAPAVTVVAPKNPFYIEAKSAFGFESNIFQTDNRSPMVGDGFWETSVDVLAPLDGKDGVLTATFSETSKLYFDHSYLDEYTLTPGLAWRALDTGATTLKVLVHGARFQERIYTIGQPLPNHAEAGWSGGGGWDLKSKLTDKTTLSWTADTTYQGFDRVPQNNLQPQSGATLAMQVRDGLKLKAGTQWGYQDFQVRPDDTIAPPQGPGSSLTNPSRLQMLTGRGLLGAEWTVGGGWAVETTVNAGYNFDLTNGFYNADVLGVHVGLRWETGKWAFTGAFDPECDWYRRRTANLGQQGGLLRTQEYSMAFGIEYAWTDYLKVLYSNTARIQSSNSCIAEPSVDRFDDFITSVGVTVSF